MIKPKLPLYRHLPGARLLPNAGIWLKGELAALFTLPLTRKPSAARRETSAETSVAATGVFDALTSAR